MRAAQLGRAIHPVFTARTSRWGEDARIAVPAVALGLTIVAGLAVGFTPLTLLGALAAIAVALVAPAIGLATIAFTGPISAPLVIPAPGFKAILVGAVVLGCIYRLPIDRPRLRPTAALLLLIGFVLYVGVHQTPEMASGYAGDLGYLVYSNYRELLTGFGAVLAAAYVLPGRSPLPFLAAALVSTSLSAVLAILTFLTAATAPLIAGLATSTDPGRASAYFGNPNYFGVFAAVAAVTALGWSIGSNSARGRALLLGVATVIGVSVVVTLSRGAVIAFAAGLACLGFFGWRPRTAAIAASGLIAAAVVLFPLFVEWRLGITDGSTSANAYALLAQSDDARRAALLAGPQLLLTSPLFGVGWGHYSALSAEFAGPGVSLGAHNWYMSVLAEGGLVGITIWLALLAALVLALRQRPALPRRIGFGVLGAYAVGSLFLEAPSDFQTSSLAIVVMVAALAGDWTALAGRVARASQSTTD